MSATYIVPAAVTTAMGLLLPLHEQISGIHSSPNPYTQPQPQLCLLQQKHVVLGSLVNTWLLIKWMPKGVVFFLFQKHALISAT